MILLHNVQQNHTFIVHLFLFFFHCLTDRNNLDINYIIASFDDE